MSNKKEQIFQSVIEHIKTKGLLNNLTISEIAKSADVGKGTVYEYFSSKDEMIAETIIYMLEASKTKIISSNHESLDFESTLRLHIQTVMEDSLEYSSFQTIIMSQDIGGLMNKTFKNKIMNKMMDLKKEYRIFIQSVLNKGIKENKISQVEDSFIIVTVGNLIMTSIMHYTHDDQDKISKEEMINKIYHLVVKLLK